MTLRARHLITAAVLALAGASAEAIEFRSVAGPAILYETPSTQGRKVLIISAGTPVEVIVELERWVKVRDPGGAINWIERHALRTQRTVMVTSKPAAAALQAPSDTAAKVFEAATDVVLEVVSQPANGWIEVRHRDGLVGHVRVTDVWGL